MTPPPHWSHSRHLWPLQLRLPAGSPHFQVDQVLLTLQHVTLNPSPKPARHPTNKLTPSGLVVLVQGAWGRETSPTAWLRHRRFRCAPGRSCSCRRRTGRPLSSSVPPVGPVPLRHGVAPVVEAEALSVSVSLSLSLSFFREGYGVGV